MNLVLDSAQKLRDNWKYLTAAQIAQLIQSEVVTIAFEATITASVVWRLYSGTVQLRAYYKAYGEFIEQATSFEAFPIAAETAFAVSGLVMQMQPEIVAALVAANGGTMPQILQPVNVTPSDE